MNSLIKLGQKARETIDDKMVDKVAQKIKDIKPETIDRVAQKAGKVVGQDRAAKLADKTKGMLEEEKIDKLAGQAKGFVKKSPDGSGAPDESHAPSAGQRPEAGDTLSGDSPVSPPPTH